MSNGIAAIIARLGLDSGDFKRGLVEVSNANKANATQMARDSERAARKAVAEQKKIRAEQVSSLKAAAGEFAGALGVTIGVAGAIEAGKQILDFAGKIQDSSDALGINVVALQELNNAFAQSGAGGEVVEKGLLKLGTNLRSAREGDDKLIASFRALGVTWKDINTLTPDEVIMRIAASAGDAQDPAERLALIVEVLGKSGLKMAAGLNAGVEAMKQMRAETSTLSKEEISALDDAGDMLTRLQTKAKVLGAQALLGKAPEWLKAISPAAQITSLIRQGKDMLAQPAANPAGKSTAVAGTEIFGPSAEDLRPKEIAVDPLSRKLIEEQADAAIKGVLGELEAKQKLGDIDADNDQRKREETKAIALIEREADDDRLKAEAEIAGHTSLRLQLEKESALVARQIADAQQRQADESDDVKRATIGREISALGIRQRETARERLDLEKRIARAMAEVGDAQEANAIAEFERMNAGKQNEAIDRQVALLRRQIARNTEELKTADELRTAEIKRQNVELDGQVQRLKNAKRERFVQDQLDPQGAAARKAAERQRDSLMRRAQREEDLRARKGKSVADMETEGQPTLKDRLKPKLGDAMKPKHAKDALIGPGFREEIKNGLNNKGGDVPGPASDLKGALDSSQVLQDIRNNTAKGVVNA